MSTNSNVPVLNVIVTSTRPGRAGTQVGTWFADIARAHSGFDVRLVDLAELNLPFLDEPEAAIEEQPFEHEHTRRWSAITASADAFVFVMPEYNHSFGAPLKNALDYLYGEWNDKPAAFVSYGMSSGGMRAVEAIKPVISALKMMPINEAVTIHLRQTLDADGQLTPTSSHEAAAKRVLDEVTRVGDALRQLRAGA